MGDNRTDRQGRSRDQTGRRRSREDLKELVLNAGVEVLERDGLGLAIGSLTYAKVFAYILETYGITVSRASVHERIWDSREDFRNAVLARAMAYSSDQVFDPIIDKWRQLFDEALLSTPEGRERVLRDLIRLGIDLAGQLPADSTAFRRQIAVKAICLLGDEPELAERVRATMAEHRQEWQADFLARFDETTRSLGLGVNPVLSLSLTEALTLLEAQISHLSNGTYLDAGLTGDDPAMVTVTWPDGTTEEWTPLALSTYALVTFVFTDHSVTEKADKPDDDG